MSAILPVSAMVPWRPRASAVGHYMKCLWRATQDRLIHEGVLDPALSIRDSSTAYASLGTCIHFTLQDGTRCRFPGPPADFAPTPQEWEEAAFLFGDNMEITRERVRASATLAATKLPAAPDGKPWRSEDTLENEFVTGHTDFLSEDGTTIGDLKTTSKPTQSSKIKHEHYVQMACYKLLVPSATKGFVLYVDSKTAAWTDVVWIDFLRPDIAFYVEKVREFCLMLMSPMLLSVAYPNLGDHCSNSWCGYTASCYKKFMPPPGTHFNAAITRRPVGATRLGPV